MSDRDDWIPIAAWSVCVFGQVGSAIRSWWMNRDVREEERRWIVSDWSKIQRGEMNRGFRMWLERQCCQSKSISKDVSHYRPVEWSFPNDYDWDEWVKHEPTTIFMTIDHPTASANQCVRNLRRYSFLASNVYTEIAQVIYATDGGWQPLFDIQLDERTVAFVYNNIMSDRIWVVLIDIKQRSCQLIIVPPILSFDGSLGSIMILYMRRGDGKHSNRLRIVCDSSQANQHEVISIDYEIRPSKSNRPLRLIAVEVARQSITIPGRRTCSPSYIAGMCFLLPTEQNQSTYVITIDQRGDFQLHQYDEWNQSVMTIDFVRRSRKAIHDLRATLPEQWRHKCYFYQFYKHIFGKFGDSHAKRHIYVPSMMYRAAEAICQSKPIADLSMLQSMTGIDMFDEIFEDQEKPIATIYLPSDDDFVQTE